MGTIIQEDEEMNCSCRHWTTASNETRKKISIEDAKRLANYDAYRMGYHDAREKLMPLLKEAKDALTYYLPDTWQTVEMLEQVMKEIEE
jgi:hypothetical protein